MAEKITPTPFDLAVIKIVETLSANIQLIDPEIVRVRSKKDILDILELNQYHWSDIIHHRRHVTTKADKETRIINILADKFSIDKRYIYKYPNHREMFAGQLLIAAEDDLPYGLMPGSVKELQDLVRSLRTELKKKEEELAFQKDMLETQRLLIKQLKPD